MEWSWLKQDIISDDFIVSSPLPDVEYPKCSIWELLSKAFHSHLDSIALIDESSSRQVTYRQMLTSIDNIASNLLTMKIDRRKPVYLSLTSSIEYVVTLLAIWKIGGVAFTGNPERKIEEIQHILADVNSEIFICGPENIDKVMQATNDIVNKVMIINGKHPECISLETLLRATETFELEVAIEADKDACLIVQSSGTSGLPKSVSLSHSYLVQQAFHYPSSYDSSSITAPVVCSLPLSHIWPNVITLCLLHHGKTIVINSSTDLELLYTLVEKYQSQRLFTTPPTVIHISKSYDEVKSKLTSLKLIQVGGSTFSPDVHRNLHKNLAPKTCVHQLFGMSEIGAAIAIPYVNNKLYKSNPEGSVGWLLSNFKAKVVNSLQEHLGPEQRGELMVKTCHPFLGYIGHEYESQMASEEGNWFHTGDLAYFDKSGCFYIVDRLKDVLKVGGCQVSPSDIETVLLSHPSIIDAAVIGINDEYMDERPYAWVVLQPEVQLHPQDIIEYVKERTSPLKHLAGVKFVKLGDIPKTVSGKILRRTMREQMKNGS